MTETTVDDNTKQGRTSKLVLAVIVLLAGIAISSRLIRSSTDGLAVDEVDPQVTAVEATPTRAADPTPDTGTPEAADPAPPQPTTARAPTPVAIPTPVPLLTPARRPSNFAGPSVDMLADAVIVGDTVGLAERRGLWLSDRAGHTWAYVAAPDELGDLLCAAELDGLFSTIAWHRDDNSQQLALYDPLAGTWSVHQLPAIESDTLAVAPNFCTPVSIEGTWAYAAADLDGVSLALSDDRGASFVERRLDFSTGWRNNQPSSARASRADLYRDGDSVVVDLCIDYRRDGQCRLNMLRFDAAVVSVGSPVTIAQADASLETVDFSPSFAGRVDLSLGGASMPRSVVSLTEIDGELWWSGITDFAANDDIRPAPPPVGTWAAGPVGEEPTTLGDGSHVRLFRYGDAVAAAVWALDGDRSQVISADPANPIWWIRPNDESGWKRLDEVPPADWHDVEAGTPVSLYAAAGLYELFVVPHEPPDRPADPWGGSGSYFGAIEIVGEHLFAVDGDAFWSTADRGITWQRSSHPLGMYHRTGARCFSIGADSLGFTIWQTAQVPALIIEQAADDRTRDVILLAPVADRVDRDKFPPCRPLHLEGRWLTGSLDVETETLTITSTADLGETMVKHHIDLSGQWASAFPQHTTFGGAVDLFQNEDWLVARLCFADEGGFCKALDVSFRASLVEPGAATEISARAEHERGEAGVLAISGPILTPVGSLQQIDETLWQIESSEVVGYYEGGEGGGLVPYYWWNGGRHGDAVFRFGTRQARLYRSYGEIVSCGATTSPGAPQSEPETRCFAQDASGEWTQPRLNVMVDWATVPPGTPVSFFSREPNGRIMVIVSAQPGS